jgi:hypothetical protein
LQGPYLNDNNYSDENKFLNPLEPKNLFHSVHHELASGQTKYIPHIHNVRHSNYGTNKGNRILHERLISILPSITPVSVTNRTASSV